MLALIVALFWLAILTPWAVMKFRNSRSEKSIDHFHAEHEVLSRQGYSVAPARRLDDAYLYEEHAYEPEHESARSRPRLTVVQDNDTYSSLESRTSWDEWERDYDYDEPRMLTPRGEAPSYSQHRYAVHASSPNTSVPRGYPADVSINNYDSLNSRQSMRVRRNRIFLSLVSSAVLTAGVNFLVRLSLLQYVTVLLWTALVLYAAAAFFAVSQGYLEVGSLLGRRATRAYASFDDSNVLYDEDSVIDEDATWQSENDDEWRRERRGYALG